MNNLSVWDKTRAVPDSALKPINGGRLKGMTDINPVWRLKTLTEQFGLCGIGWKYVIDEKRLEKGGNEEVSAFVDISLYIKVDGEWSAAIPGTGGSSFIAKESKGLYMSDECFKMALTDAISVSCKALGFGADVYWEKDRTKYDKPPQAPQSNITSTSITEKAKPTTLKTLLSLISDRTAFDKYIKDTYQANAPIELTELQAQSLITQKKKGEAK